MKKLKKILQFLFSPEVITEILRITLWIAIIFAIFEKNWMILFVTIITLGLTYVNYFFKKYNFTLPPVFEFIIVFFIFVSLFLGDLNDFYYIFPWWDIVLHSFAGMALGFIGFLILYIFYKTKKFQAPYFIIALFSFCFAVALGGIWEIFEFLMDDFFHLDMQKARNLCEIGEICDSRLGIYDTMFDLILDMGGAFVASFFGYLYLKKGEKLFLFQNIIQKIETYNKDLFQSKK